jgi:hemoglobin
MKIALLSLTLLLASPAFAQDKATAPPPTTTAPTPPPADASADELDIPDASAEEETVAKEADAEEAPARDPAAMNPAPADAALLPVFHQFGDEPGLVALMDLFMTKLVADPRTHAFFANADQKAIKHHLVEQFCVILGGPCAYTGRDMRTAHKNFNINRTQFNALVEDLQKAMGERRIPFRAQNQLLAKLAPLHRDIEHR